MSRCKTLKQWSVSLRKRNVIIKWIQKNQVASETGKSHLEYSSRENEQMVTCLWKCLFLTYQIPLCGHQMMLWGPLVASLKSPQQANEMFYFCSPVQPRRRRKKTKTTWQTSRPGRLTKLARPASEPASLSCLSLPGWSQTSGTETWTLGCWAGCWHAALSQSLRPNI